MAIVSMTDAAAGGTASSAEYNKLIDNINDLDARLGAVVSSNTAHARLNTLESRTTDASTGNTQLGSRVSALESKTVSVTKQALSTNSTTVDSTTEVSLFSYTFSVASGTNKVSCIANFDVSGNTGLSGVQPTGEGCMIVKCYLDGTVQTAQIVFGTTTVLRLTAGQSWDWSNLAAGNHTIEMRAALATNPSSNPSYRVYGTHTGFTLSIFNGQ
ncbi:hypothetical protein [Amycolatopsis sp.]|uniref:hypothetical protein n=1 Tax=Amycolatopsis sp. TaxID=37632 RepID=UPI002BC6BBF1|nr:hypothetical protein [Amycolatopsis sp.]HVV11572.1 hypothetical protein [Amycolatopsis sp.]